MTSPAGSGGGSRRVTVTMTVTTAFVALLGAAIAIAVSSNGRHAAVPDLPVTTTTVTSTITTTVASPSTTPAATITTPPTVRPSTRPPASPGRTSWPAGTVGWTVVLASYAADRGLSGPNEEASRGVSAGLAQVGVLNSGSYASLHPGYYVVLAGIYATSAAATQGADRARARGFSGAYVRPVAR